MGVSVEPSDLKTVYENLEKANKIIVRVNEAIKEIRNDTNVNIRTDSQKIEIQDSLKEKKLAKKVKEKVDDALGGINNSSVDSILNGATLSLGALSNFGDSVKSGLEEVETTIQDAWENSTKSIKNNNMDLNTISREDFVKNINSREDLNQDIKKYLIEQFDKGNKRACSLQLIISGLENDKINEENKLSTIDSEIQSIENDYYNSGDDLNADLYGREQERQRLQDLKNHLASLESENESYDGNFLGSEIEDTKKYISQVEARISELDAKLEKYDSKQEEKKQQEELIRSLNQQIFQYEQDRKKWEFDYLDNLRESDDYKENIDLDKLMSKSVLLVFLDYIDWNTTSIGAYDYQNTGEYAKKLDVDYLTILTYMYNSSEYKKWFQETYPNLEFTKENIVNIFGISEIMNNERSLEARAFLMMSDEQINDYIYLYNHDGAEKAHEFLNAFEPDINNALGWQMALDDLDKIDDIESYFFQLCKTANIGVGDGVIGCINNIMTAFNRNTNMTPTEYKAQHMCELFLMASKYLYVDSNTLLEMKNKGEISEESYGKLAAKGHVTQLDIDVENGVITEDMKKQFEDALKTDEQLNDFITKLKDKGVTFNYAYQIGSNVGNMIPSIAASMATGGAGIASNLVMFLGAYGGSYKESIRSGYSEAAANIYSLLSAGSEIGTEYFLGKISGLAKGTEFISLGDEVGEFASRWQIFSNFLRKGATDILGEIKEEEIQNVLDALFKTAVYGEPLELSGQEMIDTAIITFFTTGIMNAPNSVSNLVYQNVNYTMMNRKQSFKLDNGQVVEVPIANLANFINQDGKVDLEKLNNYLANQDAIDVPEKSRNVEETGESIETPDIEEARDDVIEEVITEKKQDNIEEIEKINAVSTSSEKIGEVGLAGSLTIQSSNIGNNGILTNNEIDNIFAKLNTYQKIEYILNNKEQFNDDSILHIMSTVFFGKEKFIELLSQEGKIKAWNLLDESDKRQALLKFNGELFDNIKLEVIKQELGKKNVDYKYISNIITTLSTDEIKIKQLANIKYDTNKINVIANLSPDLRLEQLLKLSKKAKIENINILSSVSEKMTLIFSINSITDQLIAINKLTDTEKIEFSNNMNNSVLKANIIALINDISLKQQLLNNNLSLEEKVVIISSIDNKEIQSLEYLKLGLNEDSFNRIVNELIESNVLYYNNNLSNSIKKIINEKLTQFRNFIKNFSNGNDNMLAADQEISRKFMYYDMNVAFLTECREDFINIRKLMGFETTDETFQEFRNDHEISLDFMEKAYEYYLEKYNGNVQETNAILEKYFKRYQNEYYNGLVKQLMSNFNIDERTATIIIDSINSKKGVCSYAAKINMIFDLYKNKEQQFEHDFGFSMYTTIDGVTRLNTAPLLIDMFVNLNIDNGSFDSFTQYEGEKKFFEIVDGNLIINHDILSNYRFSDHNMTYMNSSEQGLNVEAINNYLKSKGSDLSIKSFDLFIYNSDMFADNKLTHDKLNEFISNIELAMQSGKKIELGLQAGIELTLTYDNSTRVNRGGHQVYVSGITNDGLYIISWGREYLIKFKDLVEKDFYLYTIDCNFNNNIESSNANITGAVQGEQIEFLDIDEPSISDFKHKLDDLFKDCKDDNERIQTWNSGDIKIRSLNDEELFYFFQKLDSSYFKEQVISMMSEEYQLKSLEYLDDYSKCCIVKQMQGETQIKALQYLNGYYLSDLLETSSDELRIKVLRERTDIESYYALKIYKQLSLENKLKLINNFENMDNYGEFICELPENNRVEMLDKLDKSNLARVLSSLNGEEYDIVKSQYISKISSDYRAKDIVESITNISLKLKSITYLSDYAIVDIIKNLPDEHKYIAFKNLSVKYKIENINLLSNIEEKTNIILEFSNSSDQLLALNNLNEMELIEFSTLIKNSKLKANALSLIQDIWTKELQLLRNDLSIEEKVIIIASFEDVEKQKLEYYKLGLDEKTYQNMIRKLIENNDLHYNPNLCTMVKNLIYQKISIFRMYLRQFSNAYNDGFYGGDQEISRKYLKYDLLTKNGDFFEIYENDLVNIVKTIDSEASLDDINGFINRVKDRGYTGLDFIEASYNYFLEKFNGDIKQTNDLIKRYFIRNQDTHYNDLINDIISKYKTDQKTAMLIVDSINSKTGVCSYAGQLNLIFDKYKNNEKAFERDFGFPMYITIDGKRRLNSDSLLIDMFIFMNDNHLKSDFFNDGGRKFFKYEYGKLVINNDLESDFRFNEETLTYLSMGIGLNKDAINSYLQSKNSDIIFKVKDEIGYAEPGNILGRKILQDGNVEEFKTLLVSSMEDGKQIELSLFKGNILTLAKNGEKNEIDGGHLVYVSGISNDGLIVVSWGSEYIIKFEDLYEKNFRIDICELSIPNVVDRQTQINQYLINQYQNETTYITSDGPKL